MDKPSLIPFGTEVFWMMLNLSSHIPTYYEDIGFGTPIVFVHPPHMDHVVFHHQRELARHFQVVLYDIRGHGRSGVSEQRLTISRLVEDLRDLLDALDLPQVVICGYSSGGSIAQAFALAYPDRTKALILSGGFPAVTTFLLKNEFRAGMALVKSGKQRLLSHVLAFSHEGTTTNRRKLFHHCMRADQRTAYAYYEESYHYHCTGQLPAFSMPLLLLNGSWAYHLHPYLRTYLRFVHHVRFVTVANSTHQMPTRSYHSFNHAIKTFVQPFD